MCGHLTWPIDKNLAYHKCGSSLVHLVEISTALKLVGRLVQRFTETAVQDSSRIGRVMHTIQLGATICCVLALFRLIVG
nr:hypothetical protein Iba_chr15dCG6840 [Ipomoea batatas]